MKEKLHLRKMFSLPQKWTILSNFYLLELGHVSRQFNQQLSPNVVPDLIVNFGPHIWVLGVVLINCYGGHCLLEEQRCASAYQCLIYLKGITRKFFFSTNTTSSITQLALYNIPSVEKCKPWVHDHHDWCNIMYPLCTFFTLGMSYEQEV
jgi:hypothetical protein